MDIPPAIAIEVKNDLTDVYRVVGFRRSKRSCRACHASLAVVASDTICEIDVSTIDVSSNCAEMFFSSHFSSNMGSVGLVSVPSTILHRRRDRRYKAAIEHQDLYPEPSMRRGTLSNLNCIVAEKSSGGGGGGRAPPMEADPVEAELAPVSGDIVTEAGEICYLNTK